MVHFDILVIYDIEKYFNVKITPYVRYDDEIELIYDDKLPMPAMSILNKITNLPSIIANPNLVPLDASCQSHILSHEVGHILNKDIYTDPSELTRVEMYKVECLADEVAAEYIHNNNNRYSIKPILDYLQDTCLLEQKMLHNELIYLHKDLEDNNYDNFSESKILSIEKTINNLGFRIKNFKDDTINRMNILQNIIV